MCQELNANDHAWLDPQKSHIHLTVYLDSFIHMNGYISDLLKENQADLTWGVQPFMIFMLIDSSFFTNLNQPPLLGTSLSSSASWWQIYSTTVCGVSTKKRL